ncbi:MAG: hypothetical protein CM15mP74_22630 [Halieaceae bacterium]|nr:MAG: hypothetical protein CM15mP74_22630 [Halieaceae bacterium]
MGNAINCYGYAGYRLQIRMSELRLRAPKHCENNPRRSASAGATQASSARLVCIVIGIFAKWMPCARQSADTDSPVHFG